VAAVGSLEYRTLRRKARQRDSEVIDYHLRFFSPFSSQGLSQPRPENNPFTLGPPPAAFAIPNHAPDEADGHQDGARDDEPDGAVRLDTAIMTFVYPRAGQGLRRRRMPAWRGEPGRAERREPQPSPELPVRPSPPGLTHV
jgi:hypothetical protein